MTATLNGKEIRYNEEKQQWEDLEGNKVVKPLTYRELKAFCNTLTNDQLDKNVFIMSEERVIDVESVGTLECDFVYDAECVEDGCIPITDVKDNIENYEVVYPEGTPIMYECI